MVKTIPKISQTLHSLRFIPWAMKIREITQIVSTAY